MNSIEPRKADEVIDGIFHLYRFAATRRTWVNRCR